MRGPLYTPWGLASGKDGTPPSPAVLAGYELELSTEAAQQLVDP